MLSNIKLIEKEVVILGALTEQGFKRPIFSELLETQIQRAKEFWGENIETDEKTPLGKFIRITVYDLTRAYEELEATYYARFPNTARGTSLDRLCVFAGISRNPPTVATHKIKITGTSGYTIETGTLIGTADGVIFYTTEDVTIPESEEDTGTVEVVVACTELGTIGNVAVGGINKVVNPEANILSVEHLAIINVAVNEETDTALRLRFSDAIAGTGSATAEAIKAEVLRVANVRSCKIVENDKDTADADGRPPHSFETYVAADEELQQEIAAAIFKKKPVGIQSYGTVTKTVTASDGTGHTIRFSTIDFMNIIINVSVQKVSSFPADGAEQIKQKLIDYISKFNAGEDVNKSSLYGYVHSVAGVVVSEIELKTADTEDTSRISVPIDKVANLTKENVTVTVTDYAD